METMFYISACHQGYQSSVAKMRIQNVPRQNVPRDKTHQGTKRFVPWDVLYDHRLERSNKVPRICCWSLSMISPRSSADNPSSFCFSSCFSRGAIRFTTLEYHSLYVMKIIQKKYGTAFLECSNCEHIKTHEKVKKTCRTGYCPDLMKQ